MSWSSEPRTRVKVMRAEEVTRGTATRADLTTVRAPAARDLVVDRALVDDALAEGFRAGYEAGFETGIAEARQAAVDRERARASQLQSVIAQLAEASEIVRQREGTAAVTIEDEVARAGYRIAEALVGHELRHAPGR